MDIEKLIERLEAWNEHHLSVVCGDGHFACDYLCENEDCIVVRAATALSTLQAENEKLREKIEDARLEGYAKGLGEMCEENEKLRAHVVRFNDMLANYQNVLVPELRAELEKVKRERDAAVKDLNEFLAMDELCPIQCKWCKWKDTFCDGKTPEWHGIKKD